MPNLPTPSDPWSMGAMFDDARALTRSPAPANLSSLQTMFPGSGSPFTSTVANMTLGPADYAELRAMGQQRLMSNVLNQYQVPAAAWNGPVQVPAPAYRPPAPVNVPPPPYRPPAPRNVPQPPTPYTPPAPVNVPPPTGPPATPYTPPAPVNVPPPTGPPATPYTPPAPKNVPPPTGPPAQKLGAGAQNPYLNAAANGAKRAPKQAGPGARAGAATGGAMPSGSAPTNPYFAFWGRNPLNVRGALSSTGSVGSKLPGVLTAPRNFGPSPTGAVGSRLPGFATNQLTGAKNIGAGLGTALALQALPGFTAQIAPGITGRPLTEQGMETARSSAGAAGAGLMFGAPVAAAAGVGTFLGDAVGSSGGLGVANTLRGWMGMDPTDDTIGDILGRTPIGGWFGAGGEQQAEDPVQGLPATPESIATVGQMAGLDPSSIGFLQQQFDGSMALARATYAADPEGSKKQFESLYGRPMESEDDLAQVLFSKIVQESLPAALENQSAQAAALQNAAMYQDFISQYMAPIRDQYNDLGAQAAAAGYGDLALQFQGQGVSQESAIRMIPSLEALRAKQAQVDQLAQQQYQSMMSGGGATSDPLGDASTLAALGVPTG